MTSIYNNSVADYYNFLFTELAGKCIKKIFLKSDGLTYHYMKQSIDNEFRNHLKNFGNTFISNKIAFKAFKLFFEQIIYNLHALESVTEINCIIIYQVQKPVKLDLLIDSAMMRESWKCYKMIMFIRKKYS